MPTRCFLMIFLLLAGCEDDGSSNLGEAASQRQTPASPIAAESAETRSASTVNATVKTAEEIDQLVASFRGKFVVMDLWAMW